jgi:hypothetical protein
MKPIVILSIYRTPDTPSPSIDQLENEILDSSESFVLGDLNIDQINNNQNNLKSLIRRTRVKQMIKEPTRVTETTRTLIDVILTNSSHCDSSSSRITRCEISDHDLIYVTQKIKKRFKKQIETREIRNFKNINIDETKSMISLRGGP